MDRPLGAQPLALMPVSLPVFDSQTSANRSPPITVHHRLDDTHHGIGSDGGVDGRAAAGQDLRTGLRCQRLRGADDPALR